jgi:hypothetical protein
MTVGLAIAACGLSAAAFRRTESDSILTEDSKSARPRAGSKEPLGSAVLASAVLTGVVLNFAVEGESALPALLFYATVAFLVYYTLLVWTPWLIMKVVTKALAKKFNFHAKNDFFHCEKLSTADDRAIVKPCPDLLYSKASLDFSAPGVRAVKLTMAHPGTYSSLSFFTDSTDNFFVANFDGVSNPNLDSIRSVAVFGPSETSIDLAKAKKLLNVDDAIRCPSIKASVLQRVFVATPAMMPQARANQQKATCAPLFELPSGIQKDAGMPHDPAPPRFSTPGSGFVFAAHFCLVVGVLLSDFHALLSVWKVASATLLGVLAVPLSLTFLFAPWVQRFLPLSMRSVSLGCWNFNPKTGGTSADSFVRSCIALTGLLALNKSEAIYMMGTIDSDGEALSCCNDYVITCPKAMPGAWWSITAYGGDHYLIPNEAGVYSFSHQSAKCNADGSVTIHWSSKKPKGDSVLNWLPAGDSTKDCKSQLILRLYKPHQDLQRATVEDAGEICQRFQFPVVKRVHQNNCE